MNRYVDKIGRFFHEHCAQRYFLRSHKYIDRSIQLKNVEQLTCPPDCNIGSNSKLLCWKEYAYKSIKQRVNGTVVIGKNFHATRNLIIQSCGKLVIGDNVLIASDVFICNYDHGMDCLSESYLNNELVSAPVVIEDGVWLGDKAIVLKGVTIGEHSVIGAGSVVTKDIPDDVVAVGNPCRVIRKITEDDKINPIRKK